MLIDQITRAREGNPDDIESLITKFDPILKKYSRKLFWEDAYNDMIVEFIDLIHKFPIQNLRSKDDGVLVNYIAQSVRNVYLALLRDFFNSPQEVTSLDEATEALKLETIAYVDKREEDNFQDLLALCPDLTEKERAVLTQIYYWGYTSVEIAASLSTSKQNINQIKQRGLKKLRKKLAE